MGQLAYDDNNSAGRPITVTFKIKKKQHPNTVMWA